MLSSKLLHPARSGLRCLSSIPFPAWATYDVNENGKSTHEVQNLVDGKWNVPAASMAVPNPLDQDSPPIVNTVRCSRIGS